MNKEWYKKYLNFASTNRVDELEFNTIVLNSHCIVLQNENNDDLKDEIELCEILIDLMNKKINLITKVEQIIQDENENQA